MRLAVLQHAEAEGPGEIGGWAALRGHTLEHFLSPSAPRLPTPESYDLLVVLGGEMNVYQDRDYPWLPRERAALAAAEQAGKPLVGICLGAQLIADLLGTRVTQNREYELGWWPLEFTAEARAFAPGLPTRATVLHWHGDTFALPPGATRLAQSAGCGEQGFFIPGRCLALQFHLEVRPAMIPGMLGDVARWPSGPYVQAAEELLRAAPLHAPATVPVLHRLLDSFAATLAQR